MYTIDIDCINDIDCGYDNVVYKIEERDFGFVSRKILGMLYETKEEALNEAKKLYYKSLARSFSSENGKYSITIDEYLRLVISEAKEEIMYETADQAQMVIDKITIKNYLKYVMDIKKDMIYVPIRSEDFNS